MYVVAELGLVLIFQICYLQLYRMQVILTNERSGPLQLYF
jgi:hypothetical protein